MTIITVPNIFDYRTNLSNMTDDDGSEREIVELKSESADGPAELCFSDGHTEMVDTYSIGECTIAASLFGGGNTVAVFVAEEFSFSIEDYVKLLSPLSRCFAISSRGYIAYHSGEHREKVFKVVNWNGDPLIQRIVEVARAPSFTPDGRYVAYWRLTDDTVYCYDTDTGLDSGQFDTERVEGTNMGVEGVDYKGQPAFRISDTTGPGDDKVVAHISPEGEVVD